MRKDLTKRAQEVEASSFIESCPIVSKVETKEEKNRGRARRSTAVAATVAYRYDGSACDDSGENGRRR
jgi:hypothetical protein